MQSEEVAHFGMEEHEIEQYSREERNARFVPTEEIEERPSHMEQSVDVPESQRQEQELDARANRSL